MRTCSGLRTEIGVELPFLTDRGRAPVAGQHDGLIGQDQQFGADGREQLVQVAIREIEAANAPLEQHVASEDDPRIAAFPQVHDVSPGMAGNGADLELQSRLRSYVSPSSTRWSAGGLVIPAPILGRQVGVRDRSACAASSVPITMGHSGQHRFMA